MKSNACLDIDKITFEYVNVKKKRVRYGFLKVRIWI